MIAGVYGSSSAVLVWAVTGGPSFDVVVPFVSLHDVPERARVIGEIARVLEPGTQSRQWVRGIDRQPTVRRPRGVDVSAGP